MSPDLESRLYGCWLGKSIGGTLGLPTEGRMERQAFTYYDPVPTVAPPNDDLELQLVWLHVLEQRSGNLTRSALAEAWLRHIHYMWDEYGRCRWNLRRGVPVDAVGTFENPFDAAMGSPIRSEIWACLFPGDPASAAHYAALDASLDHGVEGIAGEVFFAVMQSLVLDGVTLREAITAALGSLPASTESARALELVRERHARRIEPWECREQLLAQHGSDNFTHAPLNVALTLWALLYGGSDFEASILLATNGGYDTDCTAATVGATLGMMPRAVISPRWKDPIGEGIYIGPGIQEIHAPATLKELTMRTGSLLGKLPRQPAPRLDSGIGLSTPDLRSLPGTIEVHPRDGSAGQPWANGELPPSVKSGGGASWTWKKGDDEERRLVCLARGGARLLIDGAVVVDCPPGLPYVPAPHRCAGASRTAVKLPAGPHSIELHLSSRDAEQDATVLLAYRDFHLAPWTSEELPNRARLEA